MPKLRVVAGDNLGREFELGDEPVVMGRRSSNAIHIDHSKASRRHAEVCFRDGKVYIRDLDSVNGTFVNNIKIRKEEELSPGDEVRVGGTTFRLFSDEADLPEVFVPGYTVQELIAQGGMGTVYRAVQQSMDRYVALKVLHHQFADRDDFVERFVREARAAGKLNHPNIIAVHDVGKAGRTYYFSMELVSGNDLSQIMGYRTLEYEELFEIAAKVADALDYAHRNGLVHRDIKPENIMVSDSGEVKLADLGIAKTFDAEDDGTTADGKRKVFGTPHYMSPEQARADAVDGRSDLYSLGATLYHILTEDPPFEGESNQEIMLKHLTEQPKALSSLCEGVPKAAIAVVEKLMEKDREKRYATAAEARDALREAAAGAKQRSAGPAKGGAKPRPKGKGKGKGKGKAKGRSTVGAARVQAPSRRSSGSSASIVVIIVVILGALLSFKIFFMEKEQIDKPQGPTAIQLLNYGDRLEREGRLDDAVAKYREVLDRFFKDKESSYEAQRRIDRIEDQREAQAKAAAIEKTWQEFLDWREKHGRDVAEHQMRLNRLELRYPEALGERINQAKTILRQMQDNADTAEQDAEFDKVRQRAARVRQSQEYDTAIMALQDYRRIHPGTRYENDIDVLLEQVRAAADAAYTDMEREADGYRQDRRYDKALDTYRKYNRTVESKRHNQVVTRAIEDLITAMDRHMEQSEDAVREAVRRLDFGAAVKHLEGDLKCFRGTEHEETVQKRLKLVQGLVTFLSDFCKRVEKQAPTKTDFKTKAFFDGRKPLVISGASEKGIQVLMGANIRTTLEWKQFSSAEVVEIFRIFTPRGDENGQRAINTFRAILRLR